MGQALIALAMLLDQDLIQASAAQARALAKLEGVQ
jgi:hypothetical protein